MAKMSGKTQAAKIPPQKIYLSETGTGGGLVAILCQLRYEGYKSVEYQPKSIGISPKLTSAQKALILVYI